VTSNSTAVVFDFSSTAAASFVAQGDYATVWVSGLSAFNAGAFPAGTFGLRATVEWEIIGIS
jgi:hypothetical protein